MMQLGVPQQARSPRVTLAWRGDVRRDLELAAETDVPVLITSRIEYARPIAFWIHANSGRRKASFEVVDGSLTRLWQRWQEYHGADVMRQDGRSAAPAAGTIVIPRVDELSPVMQADLFGLLEARDAGGARLHRVIATTDREPLASVHAGRLREDLFYRLNVIHLVMDI